MNDQRKYPQTYLKFEGRKEINGKRRQYWIQAIEEERFEEVMYHLLNGFIGDEPITKYLDAFNDPLSIKEFEELWRKTLREKLSIACYTTDENENTVLAGFNILIVGKYDNEMQSRALVTFNRIFEYAEAQRSFSKEFNLQQYVKAMGLYVLKDYRGDGIGEKLLEAREAVCKSVGILATINIFTSVVAQKLAAKVGFQDFVVAEYEKLSKIDPVMEIPGIHEHSKCFKFMYKLYA